MKSILYVSVCLLVLASCNEKKVDSFSQVNAPVVPDTVKQMATLEKILSLLPPDRIVNGRVSFLDETFQDWLNRTGELPPDFGNLPSIPFLPNPLVLDEGGKNIPIITMADITSP